jgi:hypothetical protein
LDIDDLREKFIYKNGKLYRLVDGINKTSGYVVIRYKKIAWQGHRLIYLLHHGYLPEFVDHIDGNRSNNKIENLREATRSQNNCNAKIRKDSASKIKNVSICKKSNKWRVIITINKKAKYIGSYKDIELAELVAIMAREKYHGNFANHG